MYRTCEVLTICTFNQNGEVRDATDKNAAAIRSKEFQNCVLSATRKFRIQNFRSSFYNS
jgi:hypothetical protein